MKDITINEQVYPDSFDLQLVYDGRDTDLVWLNFPGRFYSSLSRKEARQLRNWLNKALEESR